ncbi:16S rRNA (uracil(1498)-N(3))-methyltransferase [Neptuniibacter sp.]|uniref:16S rRNA (uracil(1498)-N(3))-methyltransferase n=1 Tax=Neptuniibacter sp. TaxID=1962643 RepID=UPI0026125662|nr:16S rRNA (uracil(1498)-N(3))-methyltransferase [Neptuniibacter sp.]MCP4598120.1 16S rRNA (uracil(1498)-N(3))-methyltransferase [Neptuniibacter sp.]
MNLIILFESDFTHFDIAQLEDRRFQHITSIHKPEIGQNLKVGLLNGQIGYGEVLKLDSSSVTLRVSLERNPPQALPLTLLLGLPRPKMLKRVLQTVSTMGVKELYLINSYRVDKSYWGSPVLEKQINEHLLLGLEQAGDTVMPNIHLRKRFKPFVEDELPAISQGSRSLVAHPYNASTCPETANIKTTLAIGPEGGFIDYEVEKLNQCGFDSIHIGERILRVETAVPALLSRLFPV